MKWNKQAPAGASAEGKIRNEAEQSLAPPAGENQTRHDDLDDLGDFEVKHAPDSPACVAALAYAKAGYKVFPVHSIRDDGKCTCGDSGCDDIGKHPRTNHGAHNALRETVMIRSWFNSSDWQRSNIGLALEGLVAVDEDPRNGGDLKTIRQPLPPTCTQLSGGGGHHLLYRCAEGTRFPKKLAQGIDLKFGKGQYIVVAPSAHASGKAYAWAVGTDPRGEMQPAQAPDWLINLDSTPAPAQPRSIAVVPDEPVRLGERNNKLTSLAGTMRKRGMSVKAIEAALLAENRDKCEPPLGDAEVRKIAASITRYPAPAASDGKATPLFLFDADSSTVWPDDLEPAAFHGIAGEIVRLIEPDSEADPAAILLQVLVWFGAAVGRGPRGGPCVQVEGDSHHTNLFAVLVGETSKARKGTSLGRVRQVFDNSDMELPEASGLSSGEGLKFAVRDPMTKLVLDKGSDAMKEVMTDKGISDKRLLVIEPEYAQVLKQGERPGNTLSPIVRCAWDSGTLETLTRHDRVKATNAHIAIVGHITIDELRRGLTATESANGFANRFLYMVARRSKTLPFGGKKIDQSTLDNIGKRLSGLITDARFQGAIEMNEAARELWVEVYPALSAGLMGLLGAVTARSEAQCVRLALIYALLDGCDAIDLPHLQAALAFWKRCEASARYVFGTALGDPIADEVLRALRAAGAAGMSRTDISNMFGRHKTVEQISVAVKLLAERRLAHSTQQLTGGRPIELWRAGTAK